MHHWHICIESRLPWNRVVVEEDVPAGSTALEAFRAAGFHDEAEHVLFIVENAVWPDDEVLSDGVVLLVFPRMHGG